MERITAYYIEIPLLLLYAAVAGTGLGGTPYRDGSYEYYVNEPGRNDDLKAIGPFIQECIEFDRLKKK